MSIDSKLLARLERLGPVRVVSRPPLSSEDAETIALHRQGPLDQPISVARRLADAGAGLKSGHNAINDLAATGHATCQVSRHSDFAALARDLRGWNIHLHRRRDIADPAVFIVDIRSRHRLSQRGFADRLGLDVRTLQNWEQGRNRPDAAALSLILLFDRHPDLVDGATFEPVA